MITVMLGKVQKQVAIVEKIKVIFNKNISIIKSSSHDQNVKVLLFFLLILACYEQLDFDSSLF